MNIVLLHSAVNTTDFNCCIKLLLCSIESLKPLFQFERLYLWSAYQIVIVIQPSDLLPNYLSLK